MKIKILILTTILTFLTPGIALAADPIQFTLTNRGFTNLGPLIGVVIQLIMFLAGLLFLAYLLIGGLSWITSNGDPKAVAAARSRITNAFIGLVIVASTYAIILIVEKVFGIRILSGFTIR